jgi:hypothetical protein
VAKNSPISLADKRRRLKSLDEFDPPYWKGLLKLPDRKPLSMALVALAFLVGVLTGLAFLLGQPALP